MPYKPKQEFLFFAQKRRLKLVSRLKKTNTKFELNIDDLGLNNHERKKCTRLVMNKKGILSHKHRQTRQLKQYK